MSGADAIAAAVIVSQGRVLLVQRRRAEAGLLWQFPAGKVEPGETPEHAAVREALEETGVECAALRLLGQRIHPATGREMNYVACRVEHGVPRPTAPREVAAVAWCTGTELCRYIPDGIAPCVRDYLSVELRRDTAGTE